VTRVRALIDTNVLVSALLFGGVPGQALDAARDGRITGIVSLHILAELREVLTRPRFGLDVHLADALAEEIALFCEVVPIERASEAWCIDADDDPVVEAALSSKAQVVITGDAHLLSLKIAGVRFATAAEFMAELG
jgi:putative PIN family toxin of toxin-antitoxin system